MANNKQQQQQQVQVASLLSASLCTQQQQHRHHQQLQGLALQMFQGYQHQCRPTTLDRSDSKATRSPCRWLMS
jgi:hypothetical protein